MEDGDNFWMRPGTGRHSRRAFVRGAGVGSMTLAGAALLACGGKSGPGSPAAAGTAPGSSAQEGKPVLGGTLTWRDQANAPTLDPHATSAVTTMNAVSPVLSRLLRFKAARGGIEVGDNSVQPDLALNLESPDAITWTVKLRTDAKFHDVAPVSGHAVEAEDIKATFARAVAPTSANRGSLSMIDPAQIETPDKNTVVFKLKYPYAPFPRLVASGVYGWILPREGAAGAYPVAKQLIGSGPFLFESYTPDVAGMYKKNPAWFGQGLPNIDTARQAIVPDASQRLAQFTSGNLDYERTTEGDIESYKRQNPKATTASQWDAGGPVLYFQLGDPASPFQDIRLRRAVNLAIDRAAFGKALLNDKYSVSFNAPLSMGRWTIRLDQLPRDIAQWYKYDLSQAKKLVEAAGATNLSIKLLYPTPHPRDPYLKTAAETVNSMLAALPWKINLIFIDYNKDWVGGGKGVRYGNFSADSIVFTGIEGRSDIDEYIYGWWHSKSTSTISRLNDPALDALIDKARTLLDENERAKKYVEAQQYMADKAYSGMGNPSGHTYDLVQPWVHNYTTGDPYGIGTTTWGNLWLKKA